MQEVGVQTIDKDMVNREQWEDGEHEQEQHRQEQQQPRKTSRSACQTNFYVHPINSDLINSDGRIYLVLSCIFWDFFTFSFC